MYQPISDRGRGPGLWASPVRAAGTIGGYSSKVLSYGPIAYWPLWETSGTTAQCLVNPLQNGTYSSDVSLWTPGPGIEPGSTAPKFDGATTLVNIASAALIAVANTSEGSLLVWTKTDGVGPWTDGAFRYAATLRRDVNNRLYITKSNGNNRISSEHVGNAVSSVASAIGHSEIVWTPWIMTWSVIGGTVKQYVGSALDNESAAGVTAWAGAITAAYIGAWVGPSVVWDGWLAHCAIFDRVLALSDVQDLGVV